MGRWTSLLASRVRPLILGMVHVQALPGSPLHLLKMEDIVSRARAEAEIYKGHKLDGLIIENMHDVPYICSNSCGPEITSCMTAVCREVRQSCSHMPLGVQVLAGCNKEALAVALAADCDFIRAEAFIYSHVADEGLMNGCAGELLRYRSAIGANHISVLCDIKKKHSSHAITSDISIEQMARDAEFFLSDGVIVTGVSTADSADVAQLKAVKESLDIPVLIGSGVTAANLHEYSSADALIIGSYFKKDGKWTNQLDDERIEAVVNARNAL
ncbi:uncharacterized protein F13E9.13, mitochondrial-like [Watersipora subatra]|uniref:uncharacterized protein F13E9.13, mitochondrial-like n=1 Tax=Watersipora subatra TaxID=2589382 RepID=UPI00355BA421